MARMIVIGVWLALLDALFILLWLFPTADPGDALIRYTIRLSLLYYTFAVLLMLRLRPDEWAAASERGKVARWAWSLAWLGYVVHVVFAMKFAHHWSHAHAIQHTQERSGFGEGIYVSHFFTLVWTLDVLWWSVWPADYARRSPWIDRLLHAFMAFMIFCGTVVYETGLTRWASVAMFVLLGGAVLFRLQSRRLQKNAGKCPTD